MKKVLSWGALIFVVFYLVTEPTSSGHLISSAFSGLRDVGNSLASFVHSISL
jgi:hypothetical protein